jgi:hypothetical protein
MFLATLLVSALPAALAAVHDIQVGGPGGMFPRKNHFLPSLCIFLGLVFDPPAIGTDIHQSVVVGYTVNNHHLYRSTTGRSSCFPLSYVSP